MGVGAGRWSRRSGCGGAGSRAGCPPVGWSGRAGPGGGWRPGRVGGRSSRALRVRPLGQPAAGQPPPRFVDDLDVVRALGPVIPDEQHRASASSGPASTCPNPEGEDRGDLMDQCSYGTPSPPAIRCSSRAGGARSERGPEQRTRDTQCAPHRRLGHPILLQNQPAAAPRGTPAQCPTRSSDGARARHLVRQGMPEYPVTWGRPAAAGCVARCGVRARWRR
jgi:hypothetical protein